MSNRHYEYRPIYPLSVAQLVMIALVLCGCAGTPSTPPLNQTSTTGHISSRLSDSDTDSFHAALEAINTQPENAREKLASLALRYPAHIGVVTNLAMAHYRCGDFAQALEVADQALNVDADIAEIHNLRGLVLIEQAQYSKAREAFVRALDVQPTLAQAHYNLGLLYDLYFQDITTALEHYTRYLAAFPDDSNTLMWVEQLKQSLEANR